MDDLIEVVTSATCHPTHCNLYAYSTSRGITTMSDLRVSARGTPCHSNDHTMHSHLVYEDPESNVDSDVIDLMSSISCLKFTRSTIGGDSYIEGGRFFLTRDFLTVKVWDTFMEREPVQILPIHQSLYKQCRKWTDSDMFFERFNIGISGDGRNLITGSYQNTFHVFWNDSF